MQKQIFIGDIKFLKKDLKSVLWKEQALVAEYSLLSKNRQHRIHDRISEILEQNAPWCIMQ